VEQEGGDVAGAALAKKRRAEPQLERLAASLDQALERQEVGLDEAVGVGGVEPRVIGRLRLAVVVLPFPAPHAAAIAVGLLPADAVDPQFVDGVVDDLLALSAGAFEVVGVATPA